MTDLDTSSAYYSFKIAELTVYISCRDSFVHEPVQIVDAVIDESSKPYGYRLSYWCHELFNIVST